MQTPKARPGGGGGGKGGGQGKKKPRGAGKGGGKGAEEGKNDKQGGRQGAEGAEDRLRGGQQGAEGGREGRRPGRGQEAIRGVGLADVQHEGGGGRPETDRVQYEVARLRATPPRPPPRCARASAAR